MSKCTFGLAFRGECGIENCAEHAELKCDSCGGVATDECGHTMGLVCGAPICRACEHDTDAHPMGSGHRRRSA